jgi:hypothetical protein
MCGGRKEAEAEEEEEEEMTEARVMDFAPVPSLVSAVALSSPGSCRRLGGLQERGRIRTAALHTRLASALAEIASREPGV